MSEIPARDFIDDDEIDLRELFGLFYARKFTIIAITFLATLIGVAYALVSVPVYQADALVQLEEKSSGGLALSSELTDMLGGTAPQSVAEIEILKSRMILGSVVEELNLDQTATPKRLPVIGNFLTRYTLPDPGWGFLSSYAWHDEAITLGALSVPDALLGEPITLTNLGEGAFTVDLGTGPLTSGKVGEKLQDPATGFSLLIDKLSGAAGREFIITQNAPANVVKNLRSNLSISEKGKNSAILQLTLKGENRMEAARILDRITEVYLLQNLTRNVAEAESSLVTPPVLAVTDPVIIGKYAGMILLAVQYHVTNVAEIKAVQKVFDTNGLKVTGAVFNVYDAKKSAYGYAATSYQYEYKPRKP